MNIFVLLLGFLHFSLWGAPWNDSTPPNERHPAEMLRATHSAAPGVAIAVGGERGLFLASSNPQITSLEQIDVSSEVVRLNQIHRALLLVANDVADYQGLRRADSYALWVARRMAWPRPETEALHQANFSWWKELVKAGKVEGAPRAIAQDFIEDATRFGRLRQLARDGKITIRKLDLTRPRQFRNLIVSLRARGENISIIDFSNAWWTGYAGPLAILKLARAYSALLPSETLWLFTYRRGGMDWKYFAFHSQALLRQSVQFLDLDSVINTQYGKVLAEMPAIEGLDVDLRPWLPPAVDLRGTEFDCESKLSGQVDFIESLIERGRAAAKITVRAGRRTSL